MARGVGFGRTACCMGKVQRVRSIFLGACEGGLLYCVGFAEREGCFFIGLCNWNERTKRAGEWS